MGYSQYVARRRARFRGCNGQQVNIPYGSILEAQDGVLLWKGQPLCLDTSHDAHEFFSLNDDSQGKERGELVDTILSLLESKPRMTEKQKEDRQHCWDKVWKDSICLKYKRAEHKDFWLWSHEFYNAPLEDLRHIALLIGAAA